MMSNLQQTKGGVLQGDNSSVFAPRNMDARPHKIQMKADKSK